MNGAQAALKRAHISRPTLSKPVAYQYPQSILTLNNFITFLGNL
jgi:hypothetical protein